MNQINRISSTILLICYFGISICQTISPYIERPLGYEKADIESVYSLRLGPDQNLYIGHQGGVCRYNGYQFKKIPFSGRSQASDNLFFDKNGRLWGRTFAGDIFYMKDDELQRHSISNVDFKILPTFWKTDNALYLKFDHKILLVDDTNFVELYGKTDYRANADFGMIALNDSLDIFISYPFSLVINPNQKCVFDEINHEKTATSKNLKRHNTRRLIRWKGKNYLVNNNNLKLKSVCKSQGELIFRESDIILKYNTKSKVHQIKNIDDRALAITGYSGYQITDFKTNQEFHLLKDRVTSRSISNTFDGIWVATLKDGIYNIPSLDILQYSLDHVNADLYRSFRLSDSLIGLGRMNGELDLLDAEGNYIRTIKLPKKSEIQSAILEGDCLYLFCDDFYQYNLKINQFTIQFQSASTKDFWCNDSCLFIATSLGMFDLYNKNDEGKAAKVIEGYWFADIEERSNNELLLASKEGLFRYLIDKNKLEALPSHWSIEPSVRQVIMWQDRIVTNIEGKGVYFLDKNYNYFPIGKDLKSVKRIVVNNEKLYVLLPDKIIEYKTDFSSRIVFDKKTIIPNLKIQDFQVTDDFLFLFLNQEYIRIPLNFKNPSEDFSVNFISFDHSYRLNNDLYLSDFDGNYFNLEFEITPSFIGREATEVRYKIGNSQWKNVPHEKGIYGIYLERLPWGKSKLEVEIRKGSKTKLLIYDLHVNKPYWLQWWFIAILIFLMLLVFYGVYRWRIKTLKKKSKREVESQRMKNQLLNAELTAIRSQMQPHFIYNVLTSIQAKILKGEKKEAYESANSFSTLMRSVLDNSQKELISVKEEVDILKSYVKLESDRFEQGVDFELKIDSEIDIEEIYIPTLICQPFVENAFKHGLRHLKSDRKLSIKLHKEDTILRIEISDNGIGRKNSAEINAQNKSYHQSFATNAMQERVERINASKNGIQVNYEINDLDEGTCVIIQISYE